MVCNGSSFVSWAATRPHFTNRQAGTSSEVPQSLPVDAPNSSVFSSVIHSRPDTVWKVMGFESTASTALLQKTTRIKYIWQKNIKQGKKNEEQVQQNKKESNEYFWLLLTRCSVYPDSCCTQSQIHINLQFNDSSNPGKKKETNCCMFITQKHRNVPSEFFLQSRGQFCLLPLYLLWYPWNPCLMLQ